MSVQSVNQGNPCPILDALSTIDHIISKWKDPDVKRRLTILFAKIPHDQHSLLPLVSPLLEGLQIHDSTTSVMDCLEAFFTDLIALFPNAQKEKIDRGIHADPYIAKTDCFKTRLAIISFCYHNTLISDELIQAIESFAQGVEPKEFVKIVKFLPKLSISQINDLNKLKNKFDLASLSIFAEFIPNEQWDATINKLHLFNEGETWNKDSILKLLEVSKSCIKKSFQASFFVEGESSEEIINHLKSFFAIPQIRRERALPSDPKIVFDSLKVFPDEILEDVGVELEKWVELDLEVEEFVPLLFNNPKILISTVEYYRNELNLIDSLEKKIDCIQNILNFYSLSSHTEGIDYGNFIEFLAYFKRAQKYFQHLTLLSPEERERTTKFHIRWLEKFEDASSQKAPIRLHTALFKLIAKTDNNDLDTVDRILALFNPNDPTNDETEIKVLCHYKNKQGIEKYASLLASQFPEDTNNEGVYHFINFVNFLDDASSLDQTRINTFFDDLEALPLEKQKEVIARQTRWFEFFINRSYKSTEMCFAILNLSLQTHEEERESVEKTFAIIKLLIENPDVILDELEYIFPLFNLFNPYSSLKFFMLMSSDQRQELKHLQLPAFRCDFLTDDQTETLFTNMLSLPAETWSDIIKNLSLIKIEKNCSLIDLFVQNPTISVILFNALSCYCAFKYEPYTSSAALIARDLTLLMNVTPLPLHMLFGVLRSALNHPTCATEYTGLLIDFIVKWGAAALEDPSFSPRTIATICLHPSISDKIFESPKAATFILLLIGQFAFQESFHSKKMALLLLQRLQVQESQQEFVNQLISAIKDSSRGNPELKDAFKKLKLNVKTELSEINANHLATYASLLLSHFKEENSSEDAERKTLTYFEIFTDSFLHAPSEDLIYFENFFDKLEVLPLEKQKNLISRQIRWCERFNSSKKYPYGIYRAILIFNLETFDEDIESVEAVLSLVEVNAQSALEFREIAKCTCKKSIAKYAWLINALSCLNFIKTQIIKEFEEIPLNKQESTNQIIEHIQESRLCMVSSCALLLCLFKTLSEEQQRYLSKLPFLSKSSIKYEQRKTLIEL